MKTWMNGVLAVSFGLSTTACGSALGGITALDKATLVSALSASGDDTADDAAPESEDTATEDNVDTAPSLIRDCSVEGARARVVEHCDRNGDGSLSDDEQQPLTEEFGADTQDGPQPPEGLPPPPDGQQPPALGDGQQPPPRGEGQRPPRGPRGQGAPMCVDGEDGQAQAQEPPPPHGGRGMGRHRWRMLAWVYDNDESGDLDEAERAELESDLAARCEARNARLLAQYDADADGTLSSEEEAQAQADLQAAHEARRAEALASYDADGNGSLSCAERQAMHEARHAEMEQLRAEREAEFDVDGSGDLDASERAAKRAAIKERIRSGEPGPGEEPPAQE
ncbi:MAG: hypothetical protein AB2A00_09115 [Myxococcota bacterium]